MSCYPSLLYKYHDVLYRYSTSTVPWFCAPIVSCNTVVPSSVLNHRHSILRISIHIYCCCYHLPRQATSRGTLFRQRGKASRRKSSSCIISKNKTRATQTATTWLPKQIFPHRQAIVIITITTRCYPRHPPSPLPAHRTRVAVLDFGLLADRRGMAAPRWYTICCDTPRGCYFSRRWR